MARFEVGNPGGPGRPKGSFGARHKALLLLDSFVSDEPNLARLKGAFQEAFDADPLAFFRTYIMPLIPRTALREGPDYDQAQSIYLALVMLRNEQSPMVVPPSPDETP